MAKQRSEHTKGELEASRERVHIGNQTIADCCYTKTHQEGEANANRIVLAVNCHDDLYEALKGVTNVFENWGTSAFYAYMYKELPQIKKALSKAEVKNV